MKKALISMLLVTLPIGIGFIGLAEIYLRLLVPQEMTGTWLVTGPRGVVLNKADGTTQHQLAERTVRYRFNRFHQRGADAIEGGARVLVIGASYTFGWLVEEHDSPPALLQSMSDRDFGPRRLEFLNAGTGGWGLDSYLAYLEIFGDAIAPKAVVVSINGDSFRRAMNNGLYTLAAPGSADLAANTVTPPHANLKTVLRAFPFYEWVLDRSHLAQFLRKLMLGGLTRKPVRGAADPQLFMGVATNPLPDAATQELAAAILHRMATWCRSRKIEIIAIADYHPSDVAGVFGWLHNVTTKLGIPLLDLQAPMAAAINGAYESHFIANDGHPNERTNRLAADLTWPWLKPRLESLIKQ